MGKSDNRARKSDKKPENRTSPPEEMQKPEEKKADSFHRRARESPGKTEKKVCPISKKKKKNAAGGRKNKKAEYWTEGEGLRAVKSWKRGGLSDEIIAGYMEISRSTLNEWKKKYPALSDAFTCARATADGIIEDTLFQRAQGQIVPLKKHKVLNDGTVVEYVDENYIQPDTKAIMFYLASRMPEKYSMKGFVFEKEEAEEESARGVVEIVAESTDLEAQEAAAIEEARKLDAEAGGKEEN